jgi:multidrug efflux system outer membrane protein
MRRTTISAWLAALLPAVLMLNACSLAPDYERPEMPVPEEWNGPDAARTDGATAAETPWRELFTDPELRSVIELALENNRDLRAAALTVERARALYRIERSDLYPDGGASASAESFSFATDLSGSGESETATFEQYGVNLGIAAWELDFFGRIRSLEEAALQRYFATREAHAATRIALISAVASAYLRLAADRESLALAEATLEAQTSSYDLIRQSTELGMTSELDLRQAQSQVDASRADLARLRGQIARDRNALGLLTGTPVPDDLLPDGLDAVTEMHDLAPGVPSEVLLRRPDVLAAEHRLRAANADIGAARAAFFPRIALTGSGGTLSGDLSGLFGSGSGVWTFVAGIDVPIFTGGALRAGLDASYVERDLAVAEYEKAIQTAFAEVSDALVLRETLTDRQEAQESLVEALREAHRLSRARYDVGMEGYLTVLVAERSLYSARQGLVAARLADELNRVTLFKVLGGGA